MIKGGGFITIFLVSIFSLAAFAADSGAGSEDRGQFEKLLNAYQERLATKNVDGILELYSSDPVFIPEYAQPAVGRDAVRKAYEWVFATLKLNGRFIK